MLKGTIVLFERKINGEKFTRACLKKIVEDNKGKVCKLANDCIVTNIRMRWGKIVADYNFPMFVINCCGSIGDMEKGYVSEFTLKKLELVKLEVKK